MSSQISAVTRREKQLQELLEGNCLKQALDLCDKSLRKGDKGEELLVIRINILLRHPEPARRQQGRTELDEILQKRPPISEAQALVSLNAGAQSRKDFDPRIDLIWERALTVRPQDEKLYELWFKTKFLERKWRDAQRAAITYMKKFPQKSEPFFWNIIACALAGTDGYSSESDRKIMSGLAFGFLSKAAADASANNEPLTNGRVLRTTEDLLLLLRIYRLQGKYEEALLVLNSPQTGINSRIGNNSSLLVMQKIELYELCSRWMEEHQFCRELLEDAHPVNNQNPSRVPYHNFGEIGDDWKTWVGLITAATKINDRDNMDETEHLIQSFIRPKTISRNARVALLRFYSANAAQGERMQQRLLAACFEYFVDYGSKTVCFRDLKRHVSRLERSKQETLVQLAARHSQSCRPRPQDHNYKSTMWIATEINSLKLDYFLLVSGDDNKSDHNLLNELIGNCLRLYSLSLPLGAKYPASERRPGDDAAILAVIALIRLAKLGRTSTLLQCIAILETVLFYSKHNFDALLILIRLEVACGTGSRAIEHYSRLSIKNLQYNTLSWLLYTRISTIHPFETVVRGENGTSFNHLKVLRASLGWHETAGERIGLPMQRMLRNGQYNTLFDALSTSAYIRLGFGKYLLLAELQHISRLSGSSEAREYTEALGSISLQTEDTRDTRAFPECEAYDQMSLVDSLECGPRPEHQWLGMQFRWNLLWEFLHDGYDCLIDYSVEEMLQHNISEPSSATCDELEADTFIGILRDLCIVYSYKLPPAEADNMKQKAFSLFQTIDRSVTGFASALTSEPNFADSCISPKLNIPGWTFFHASFLCLELFRFSVLTLEYVLVENANYPLLEPSFLKNTANHIRECIANAISKFHQQVGEIQNNLKGQVTISKLVQEAFGDPDEAEDHIGLLLRKLIGRPRMEEISYGLCASWVEALDGLKQVKSV